MTWSADAWERTSGIRQAIIDHPFVVGVADGSLPRELFTFYLVQDARYLTGYAAVLATTAARARTPEDIAFYAGSAQTAIVAERALHGQYLSEYAVSAAEQAAIDTAPSAAAYLGYLHQTALSGSWGELVAAVLPCFWIYQYVGDRIASGSPDLAAHPYRAWTETYADPRFRASVEQAKAVTDSAAARAGAGSPAYDAMLAAFERACEYEWMFWDAAWRRETWPTAGFRAAGAPYRRAGR